MAANDDALLIALNEQVDRILQGRKSSLQLDDLPRTSNLHLEQLKQSISTLVNQYSESYQYILDLSNGKLETQAPLLNSFATPFKQLQAQLLHLTWQIQQISEGDLEQKVMFSGDFSHAMNLMIKTLREKRRIDRLNVKYVQELKELNATKDRFFSIIAHDLKNPFYGLLGMSDVLLEHIRNEHTEELEDFTIQLKNSAEQGYKLLLNLLDWSRIQTGQLEVNLKGVLLKPLLEDVLGLVTIVAKNKQIVLTMDCPDDISVVADTNILQTVMRNLVSNALKFTYPGGQVKVSAAVKAGGVQLSVKDNGIGMNAKILDSLFKLDSTVSTPGTSNERGTGLGLILCKEFLRKMGSDIVVKSEPEKGSSFRFRLKLANKPQ